MPEKKQRYRVGSWDISKPYAADRMEEWLNEGDEEHRIWEIYKNDKQVIIIMHLRCGYRVKKRRVTKVKKKVPFPAKVKATPKTKTKAKTKAKK